MTVGDGEGDLPQPARVPAVQEEEGGRPQGRQPHERAQQHGGLHQRGQRNQPRSATTPTSIESA